MAPSPELSYLQRVVMEIMETEHTYVQDLHSIVEGYLAHIIDTADLPIIPEQVCALFGNIEDIYEFNSELLQELDLCRNDPVAIARCFVLKRDYFEIYTQYCTNYPNSVAALTDCMRNKTLLKFFMDRQEALKHPLPLGSYLLKPVQRILKYHLLLQEIAKHFDPDEEGYDVVEEAINTMTEVAWYINTMKRKHEHAVRLQEVQSLLINWRGPDLTTYGELVLEETFRFHHTKNNRTLFLFERVLLITKRRGENFIYKTHISCSMLMLMEGEKDSLCFSVTHYKHPKHPHIVQARTLDEKKLWTHHIKRLILENHHTIIPQKAKEVILEMDPMYEKYRFNWSERKKKTQSDDFTHTRHSEFTKQLMENNKSMLKQSVSEGELRGRWQVLSVEDARPCRSDDAAHCHLQDEELEESAADDDEEWQAHGNPRVSEREDRAVCEDPNTNQTSQRVSQFRGFEQEIKSMSGDQRLSVDLVSAVEGTEQCAGKDGALNLDGHSSEEEVEENGAGSQNHSILPSSVLDKAGVIAEHFIANARRSLTPVELRSPHRTPQEVTPSKNTTANSAPLSPREEKGSEQHQWNRRESILSKKEQLLIDKIRNYYENAEEEDAGFSLKRRESLSYIPSGLVRTSVSRLNKIPLTDHQTTPPNTQSSPLTSSIAPSDTSTEPDKPRRLFSTEASVSHRAEKSEECFRSSAEMIKVWQEMEKQVTSSRRENTSRDLSRFRGTSSLLQGFSRNAESRGRQVQLKGAEDLSTITEESAAKGKEEEKEKASTENAVWSLTKNLQSTDAVNQPRRRVSATTVYTGDEGNIQSLTDRETGKSNLALSLDLQRPHASSVRNVTILSPELSHFLKSPMPVEGFPWPDVRKLRSMYTSLECPSLAPLSPDCRTDNRVSPIPQTGSLDQKLSSFDWTNVQNGNMNRDYCVTAQGALPNNRTITVLEKVKTHAQPSLSQNQVRIQSPMSREKTLSLSISQRCQLYEDLDEAVFRTKPESRNKDNKTDQHSSATQHSTF